MSSKIKGPIFTGRSFEEYIKMFNLNLEQIKDEKILDCAGGASTFTAKMTGNGYKVKAVDLLYDKDPDFLQQRCKTHLNALIKSLASLEHLFVWNFFKDLSDLKSHRMNVCHQFFNDYQKFRESQYIKGDILNLPFKDNAFHKVLSSHLLFIYDHRLSYNFHIDAINEMLRVSSKEVLIYPLVKHKNKKSEYVKGIMDDLGENMDIKLEKVDYEFRKGATQMMKILKH